MNCVRKISGSYALLTNPNYQPSEVRGLRHSPWPDSVSSPWAEAQHQSISSSTSGTLLLNFLDVHITFSLTPAFSTKCVYSQILIKSDDSTPFQQFQVPFPVSFDPWSTPRLRSSLSLMWLIMLRPCLQCPLGHGSL